MLMTWYKRQVAAEIKLNDHIFYIKPTNDRSREAFRWKFLWGIYYLDKGENWIYFIFQPLPKAQ